jgi:hypothetical protein
MHVLHQFCTERGESLFLVVRLIILNENITGMARVYVLQLAKGFQTLSRELFEAVHCRERREGL